MKSLQFNTTISGKKKVVTVVEANPYNKTKSKVNSSINHIFVLDRSVSMAGHINTLIDQVQYCMSQCRPNDLVSVVYFASYDQCEVVLQLANPLSEASRKVLNTLRSTIGLTCFSTPLNKIKDKIIPSMGGLSKDYQTVITLFTDGEPCVPWSVNEEIAKVLETCKNLAENVAAINTIGYSNYYNKAFLQQISESTEFGKVYHNNDIEKFGEEVYSLVEDIRELSSEPLDIKADGCEILLVTGELSSLKVNELNVKNSSTDNQVIFLISDKKPPFSVNGITKFGKLNKENLAEYKEVFFRMYAFEKVYSGDRHTALDIVSKNLKDKYFAEMQAQAFTNEEVQVYQSELRTSAFYDIHRYKTGKCRPNFVPKSDAPCVIGLLQALSENGALYLPFHEQAEKYKRIGRKAKDTHNIFKKSAEIVASPMSELILNSSGALNVSIRFSIKGTVSLNPKSAKRVGLPKEVNSSILRNHTFIKDGNLNIKQAVFNVTKKDLDGLDKYQKSIKGIEKSSLQDRINILIDFTKLPLINKTYLDSLADIKTIYEDVFSEMTLQSERKLYNYVLDEAYKADILKRPEIEYKGYTEEQIEVLQDHGIGKTGIYQGVNVVVPKSTESDFYNTKVIEFSLKGCSSIPKVSDALEGKKKDNPCIKAMLIEIDDFKTVGIINEEGKVIGNGRKLKVIEKESSKIKEDINKIRFALTKHRLAVALTGGWFQGLDESGKYDPKDGRPELTIKADYKKCYFTAEAE